MRELDDTALERQVRRVLTERLGSLTLELTEKDLERMRAVRDHHRRRRTLVVLGLAAALVLPAGWLVAGAPLPRDATIPVIEASPAADASITTFGGPADLGLRATWVADVPTLASLQNGSGRVSVSIDSSGERVSLTNLAPGAAFAGSAEQVAADQLRVVLDRDSGGCEAGDAGLYRWTLSADGSQLTLAGLSDACVSRREALERTWARSLVGATYRGAGIVDTMGTTFAVSLPDDAYEARTLDDFIEIGASNGFSLMVFKNPQGFVDACSDQEERYPYTPGAAAFVDYYRQNDAFTVVEATPLQIDGHDAIHLVTKVRVEGARCPGAELYALTPRACNCHFLGGDDSLYLVDVDSDTFLFQLSPTTDSATELPIISTIRIPYLPGEPSP